MTDWTEETLRKAASWKAFKEGKSLFENGAVTDAKRGSTGYQGSVAGGRRPLRVSVIVRSASDLEAKCPCPDNQSTGAVCAHAVAVGLAILSGKPAAAKVSAAVPVESKAPASAWQIVFPQNWRDSLQRGKLAASLVAATDAFDPEADGPLIAWLSKERVLPKPGLTLHLDGPQTCGFLEAISDHPRVAVGKDRTPLTIQANGRIPLADTVLNRDEIQLIPEPDGRAWIEIAGAFFAVSETGIVKLGGVRRGPPDSETIRRLALGRVSGIPVTDFFTDLDHWLEWIAAPDGAWLDSLHFIPAKLGVELQLEGSLQHLEARLQVKYDGSDPVVPGLGKVAGLPKVSNNRCLVRDLTGEAAACRNLESAGFAPSDPGSGLWVLKGETLILEFLTARLPSLRKEWNVSDGQRFTTVQKQIAVVRPRIDVRGSGEDWLSFDLVFESSDGSTVPAEEVRRLLRSGRASGKVASGKHLVISNDVSDLIEPMFEDLDLRQQNGCFMAKSGSELVIREISNKLANSRITSDSQKAIEFELPSTLRAEMRPYQKHGAAWLQDRVTRFGGALLGDDMGLGKTLQTIALIERLFLSEVESNSQVLVIATASLLGNWKAEFAKFAPARSVQILHGSGRDELREGLKGGQVIITSYGTLARDLAWHLQQDYLVAVVDEASLMRNPDTDHAKAVSKLKARHRVALTGTPVENGIRDLWSIFRFVQPGWLGGREDFKSRYENAMTGGGDSRAVMERLKLKISPFFLRRTKDQVAPDLPTKLVIDEFCDLTADQQSVYKQLLEEGRRRVDEMLDSKNSGAARMRMLTALLRLRQTCCDLAILGNERFNQMLPAKRSGKLQRLLELLEEAISGGHKILVFSQFQKQLLEIQKCVEDRGWSCFRLDGQTRDRQKLVDGFQSPDGPPLFLISLKAGGYGLNLTAADTVIHFDPWWNPAAEAQATDRAHRIGQTRPVTVYRLLTRGTVEEKVVRLQEKKRNLASVIDEAGEGDPVAWGAEDFKAVLS
jgi:superfamily II DNA or RNA helicase